MRTSLVKQLFTENILIWSKIHTQHLNVGAEGKNNILSVVLGKHLSCSDVLKPFLVISFLCAPVSQTGPRSVIHLACLCTHPNLKAWVNIFTTVVYCRKFRSVIALASATQTTVTHLLAWKVDFKLVL